MWISTQPSAPKPVARAMSGPHSFRDQRNTASGGSFSHRPEIAASSTAVTSKPIRNSAPDIVELPYSSRSGKLGLEFGTHRQLMHKPTQTLTQTDDFTNHNDGRRAQTRALTVLGN